MMKQIFIMLIFFCLLGCDRNDAIKPPDYNREKGVNWIAFVSKTKGKEGVYVIDENGNNLTRLIKNRHETPSWSHDGKKIVCVSVQRDNNDIYLINADGKNYKRLTNSIDLEWNPVWSNDDARILFATSKAMPPIKSGISIIDSTGKNLVEIINNIYSSGGVCRSTPCWSPDNAKVAFHSDLKDGGGVFITDIDGQNEKHVPGTKAFDGPFAWPSNTKEIAVVLNLKEGSEIYLLSVDGDNQKRLTCNKEIDTTPSWSPDGKQICFASDRDGNYEIYKMTTDGNNQMRLTHNLTKDVWPYWSPDGRKIVYVSTVDGVEELYIMNADGTNQIRLTKNGGTDPSWRPITKVR
jgi:Tol biopolymer transport system component